MFLERQVFALNIIVLAKRRSNQLTISQVLQAAATGCLIFLVRRGQLLSATALGRHRLRVSF